MCSPKLTGRQKWITIYSIETTQHTYTAIMESSLQFLGNRSNKKHNLWVIIKARVLRDLCHQQKKCVTKLQEITEERDCFVCVCGSEGFLRNQICTGALTIQVLRSRLAVFNEDGQAREPRLCGSQVRLCGSRVH